MMWVKSRQWWIIIISIKFLWISWTDFLPPMVCTITFTYPFVYWLVSITFSEWFFSVSVSLSLSTLYSSARRAFMILSCYLNRGIVGLVLDCRLLPYSLSSLTSNKYVSLTFMMTPTHFLMQFNSWSLNSIFFMKI